MKYRVLDLQNGGYYASGEVFNNKKDIRARLLSYHNSDLEKPLTRYSLNDLLEIGGWELEAINRKC